MKKTLLAVVAALAMVSCSQNEIDEIGGSQNGKAEIKFGYSPIGRATVTTTDNFNVFKVSAYTHGDATYAASATTTDLIPTTQFDYNKSELVWKAENNAVFYWPTSGYVTFFGYSPATIDSYSKSDAAAPTLTYTVNSTIASQEDLLVTQETKSATDDRNSTVSLKFTHALTQVYFKLIGEDANLTYAVNSIAIKGVKDEGKYTYGVGWDTTSDATLANYTIEFKPDALSLAGKADTNSTKDADYEILTASDQLMLLMPQTLNGVTIEVTYSATKSGVEVHSASTPVSKTLTGSWSPKDKVVYKLILKGDKIEIEGEIDATSEWTEKNGTMTE